MTTTTRTRRAQGFTLIELMIVTAIIGILASVAIPNFQKLALRSKTAERTMMMLRIKDGITSYYVRNGSILNASWSTWNPPYPPTTIRRPLQNNQAGWSTYFSGSGNGNIGAEIEGSLYYSYIFYTTDQAGSSQIQLWAYGDLDGDSLMSQKTILWQRQNGTYQVLVESPPTGMEDDGTYGTF